MGWHSNIIPKQVKPFNRVKWVDDERRRRESIKACADAPLTVRQLAEQIAQRNNAELRDKISKPIPITKEWTEARRLENEALIAENLKTLSITVNNHREYSIWKGLQQGNTALPKGSRRLAKESKPRKLPAITGEHNIYLDRERYRVVMEIKRKKHSRYFEDLNSAIEYRDYLLTTKEGIK